MFLQGLEFTGGLAVLETAFTLLEGFKFKKLTSIPVKREK
jgi:hypothetical protein